MSKKHTLVRSAAAATAALLMTATTAGPALADHDHGQGRSQDGGSRHASAHRQDGGADENRARAGRAGQDRRDGATPDRSNNGRGDERGNGHTPVTVCHLLGNGGYHLLTMDDNALAAHQAHGDLYPVPQTGCPTGTAGSSTQTTREDDTEATTSQEDASDLTTPAEDAGTEVGETEEGQTESAGTSEKDSDAVVAGVEAFAGPATTRTGRSAATVAGVEAARSANRAAPVAGPLGGILPQTGAGRMLTGALVAGLGLLAGGTALVSRRRQGAL